MPRCCICGIKCGGLPIRHTRHLIRGYPSRMIAYLADPAIPRDRNGRMNLCDGHQRAMFFAKGFLPLLLRKLEEATWEMQKRRIRAGLPE